VKVLTSSVLGFEAIVVALGIPVAARIGPLAGKPAAVWGGLLLVLLCVVALALVRRPGGLWAGWAVQGLVIASGLVVPVMAVLGSIFALLWWAAVHYGRRADALDARRAAAAGETSAAALAPPAGPEPEA
jgi:hypothetical protein